MDELTGILSQSLEAAMAQAAPSAPAPASEKSEAFARLLEEAMEGISARPEPLPPAIRAFNALNLLNGQYPPPESGAGFLFTHLVLKNAETP